jgi:transposase, IS5 family
MREAGRQTTFADIELRLQEVSLEPELAAMSAFVDSHPEMIEQVRCDLVRGLNNPGNGRPGITASQVLRSLLLIRIKNLDYRELRERINDGLTLRQFTDFYYDPVPKHDAFNRSFNRLTSETLKTINDSVVEAAVALGLEDGSKLRVDTTVVETDIRYPTDATLLWDVVRVVTRLVRQLAKALNKRCIKGFHNRLRAAKRRMYELQRMTNRQRVEHQKETYRALIEIAEEVVANAKIALDTTKDLRGETVTDAMKIDAIRDEIAYYCSLGEQVADQARRRVLDGEQVPNDEKIFSIFETHTDLIKRGKVRTPVEFGHKVFLAESGTGLITQYEVLKGNPADEIHVVPSLKNHRRTFHCAPKLYAGDRGFDSERNVTACERSSVETICIPQRGGCKTPERRAYEKSPAFKKAQKFRAGIEGRISVLFRGRGMKRCRAEGAERFELFVGAAVLANNLMVIAALLIKRAARRRKPIH